ncbi:MAG: hypothetical protein KIS92_20095 [Planctomycetota bacterium]|nr:hypothetical protein [Planctomycetota bacterium]
MTETYLNLHEVAIAYGYKYRGILGMARRGTLPGARKCGSQYRVRRDEIEKAWGVIITPETPTNATPSQPAKTG